MFLNEGMGRKHRGSAHCGKEEKSKPLGARASVFLKRASIQDDMTLF
jgi:hypothetical protein